MRRLGRITLVLIILCGCVGCDQATKFLALERLAGAPPRHYLGGILRLQLTENPGAFLSLGAGFPDAWRYGLLTLSTAFFLAVLLIYLLRSRHLARIQLFPLALVLGGGVGNLIDRIFRGGLVVDFLNLGIGPVRTGIFNVADVAITFGVVWLALLLFTERRGPAAPR